MECKDLLAVFKKFDEKHKGYFVADKGYYFIYEYKGITYMCSEIDYGLYIQIGTDLSSHQIADKISFSFESSMATVEYDLIRDWLKSRGRIMRKLVKKLK